MGRAPAALFWTFALLCLGAAASAKDARQEQEAATRARMGELVEALRVALPLSLDPADFAAEANRARLDQALRRLRDGATALSDHARGRDVGFEHLASALARDAHEIQHRFQTGRLEEARFLLGELANDCVDCHSRLPYGKDSELGRSLWNAVDVAALPLGERVRLQVATRQLGPALQSYETLLGSDVLTPAQLDLGGYDRAADRLERMADRAGGLPRGRDPRRARHAPRAPRLRVARRVHAAGLHGLGRRRRASARGRELARRAAEPRDPAHGEAEVNGGLEADGVRVRTP